MTHHISVKLEAEQLTASEVATELAKIQSHLTFLRCARNVIPSDGDDYLAIEKAMSLLNGVQLRVDPENIIV